MANWKSYKIDLSEADEQFLKDRKKNNGIAINWQLTEAVKMYIDSCKQKEGQKK